MINMAHTLRKEVVAEGVEREDQFRLLEQLGCEKVQGFLFAPGLTADEVARFACERLRASKQLRREPQRRDCRFDLTGYYIWRNR